VAYVVQGACQDGVGGSDGEVRAAQKRGGYAGQSRKFIKAVSDAISV
jgi:hypothetical protein